MGAYLAIKKFNLIYGGGSNGLMGTVANSVKLHGGTVTGIIPRFLVNKENINKNIDKTIIVKNMVERKNDLALKINPIMINQDKKLIPGVSVNLIF